MSSSYLPQFVSMLPIVMPVTSCFRMCTFWL